MRKIVTCIDCLVNKLMRIELDDDVIVSRQYLEEPPSGTIYCGPGLIDLQVNGYVGVDFNTFPIKEAEFMQVISALVQQGVSSFFPTIITNSDRSIVALLEQIDRLCTQNSKIAAFVKGIHLEGPFISPLEGARGAHDRKYVKAPDWPLFQRFQKASGHRIKIVTLSPELDGAFGFIEKCVQEDIIVALGHTAASPEQIRAAIDAGASLSTHLGNGAPLSVPRNSNFIYEQLADDRLSASLIADGFHLPNSFLKIALRIKQNNALLVSDSTMFAGMPPGVYHTHIGGRVRLEEDGRLSPVENNKILAGATASILDGINHLLDNGLVTLQQGWSLASIHPNQLLRHTGVEVTRSGTTDLVVFEYQESTISILSVFKNGKRIYAKARP
ncbi:MAG: hypothetical protein KTR30_22815 [Saprospiraceae bacterium]|nr:hypothetical protein [Saprospiraceae bacterium]